MHFSSYSVSLLMSMMTRLCQVKAGHVHLCRVAGNNVWAILAGDVLYLCGRFSSRKLYVPLTFNCLICKFVFAFIIRQIVNLLFAIAKSKYFFIFVTFAVVMSMTDMFGDV